MMGIVGLGDSCFLLGYGESVKQVLAAFLGTGTTSSHGRQTVCRRAEACVNAFTSNTKTWPSVRKSDGAAGQRRGMVLWPKYGDKVMSVSSKAGNIVSRNTPATIAQRYFEERICRTSARSDSWPKRCEEGFWQSYPVGITSINGQTWDVIGLPQLKIQTPRTTAQITKTYSPSACEISTTSVIRR
jgi:hypothetical protein